jgi:hypothetical protein
MGGKRNGYGMWDKGSAQGRELPPTEPWGGLRITCCEAENPGGQSTPLCGGLAAGRQDADLNRKKRKQGRLRFFLPYDPRPRAGGCPSPFEPLMKGVRPEGMERSGMTGESKPNLFVLVEGEARRRGGGTIYAAAKLPPDYAHLVGWAALGGLITLSSPRCLYGRSFGRSVL